MFKIRKKDYKLKYFMSYLHIDGKEYGTGNFDHTTNKKIDSIYYLVDVAKDIERINGYKQNTVVISCITLLEDNRSLWEKIKNYL